MIRSTGRNEFFSMYRGLVTPLLLQIFFFNSALHFYLFSDFLLTKLRVFMYFLVVLLRFIYLCTTKYQLKPMKI